MIGGLVGKLIMSAIGLAVVAGAVTYVVHTIEEKGRLTAELDHMIDINQHNADQHLAEQERQERERVLLIEEREQARERTDTLMEQLEAIADAPASEDGPVAPVLRAAIASLRDKDGDSDAVRDFEAGDPGSPTDLRAPAQ